MLSSLSQMIFRITHVGEPVLRQMAKPVSNMKPKALERLVQDMIATMRKARGVGIAAPQVGKSLRLFIVAPEPSTRYPKSPRIPPVAMINPQLIKGSKRMVTDWEGCLSVPGLRALVPRHYSVEIEFTALNGRRLQGKLSGFVARIFQHEFDHINGMVYLDRVADTRTFMMEAQYRRMMTRSHG